MAVNDYDHIFHAAALEWDVDPDLLKALATQESGGKPGATSSKGALGLTGIMPATAKGLGVTDLTDPVQQIYAGAKYLNEGLTSEKTPEDALRYYHGGPKWRDAFGPESKAYAPAVTARYVAIQKAKQPTAAPQLEAPESPDDFLNRTAGTPAATSSAEDPDAFLARTGGKVAPAAAPAPPVSAGENEYGITDDPQQFNAPGASSPALDRVGSAVANAWHGENPLMSPDGQAAIEGAGPVGRFVTSPLLQVGGAVLRGGAALGAGAAALIGEGATAAGQPALGRDLNMLAQVAPFARVGTGMALTPGAAPSAASVEQGAALRQAVQQGVDRIEAPLPEAFRDAPGVTAPAMVGDASVNPHVPEAQAARMAPEAMPRGPDGQPLPRSVGAAASRDTSNPAEIGMTAEQIAAYRSVAEKEKLHESQQPGIRDAREYIPGVTTTAAEIEQTVNTAREAKALNMASPDVSAESKAIAAENNERRKSFFADISGSNIDVLNAKAARAAQAESDLAAAFGNKKPADATPVAETIKSILKSPRGSENSAVQQYIRPLMDRLVDADGNLKTDPEQLYGIREDIARMQSKAAKAQTPTLDHVNGQLQEVKSALDDVIENGAPGYRQYMDNYATASRPIDAMQTLQEIEPKLIDTAGRMQLSSVQRALKQIVISRASPGLNPFKSITDDQMQQLWNLRDDLRRSASAEELARTKGSDTAQNFFDAARGVVGVAGTMAAHGAANALSPGWGSVGLAIGKNALAPITQARTARKQTARGLELLHPDMSKYRQNPLIQD